MPIESAVQTRIQEVVDASLSSITYNLGNVFGGLLYSLKLELEKEGGVGDIDELIRVIVTTSRHTDRDDGEDYPIWNEGDKRVNAIMARLEKALQRHGIEQSWNIGKNKEIKNARKRTLYRRT